MSREIPASIEAEESLLGAVLIRPSIMNDLAGTLDPSDFYKPQHRDTFLVMLELHGTGKPIDAITTAAMFAKMGLDSPMTTAELIGLYASSPSVSNYGRYADVIIEHSRRRRLIQALSDIVDDTWDPTSDIDELVKAAESINLNDMIAPRSAAIEGLYSLEAFADVQALERQLIDDAGGTPWLIPHILKARWRTIIVAGEGIGKAVLMRFLAFHVAAGRDPWDPRTFIEPRRVLYVDVENPGETIMHQFEIANRIHGMNLFEEVKAHDSLHIWHREGGMNLRDRRPEAEFEAVLQKVQPDIVMAGPMYKWYRRSPREDMEQAALEFTEILDNLRTRYNFALVLEHHAPKASGGGWRQLDPVGSSLFMRWPEIGITLEVAGNESMTDDRYELSIGRFRRDRVVNDWPAKIERNPRSQLAWTPFFPDGRGARVGL